MKLIDESDRISIANDITARFKNYKQHGDIELAVNAICDYMFNSHSDEKVLRVGKGTQLMMASMVSTQTSDIIKAIGREVTLVLAERFAVVGFLEADDDVDIDYVRMKTNELRGHLDRANGNVGDIVRPSVEDLVDIVTNEL